MTWDADRLFALERELRLLGERGGIAWQRPMAELDSTLGMALPTLPEWMRTDWWGPIDRWMRPTASISDLLVDPHGSVTVVDRGTVTTVLTEVHPDWITWLHRRLTLAGGLTTLADPDAWPHVVAEGSLDRPSGMRVRFSLTRPPYTPRGPTISLRMIVAAGWTLDDLVARGALPSGAADLLRLALDRRVTVIIGGATGSGKTTVVGALIREVQRVGRRVILIEDTRELPDPDYGFAVDATRSGVSIARGVRYALRQYPDLIVVGEVRGEEALTMLEAASTGHPGLATIHATDARSAIANMERLATRVGDIRPDYVRSIITSGSVPIVVAHMYQRRMMELIEILPASHRRAGDGVPVNPLWTWDAESNTSVPAYPPQGRWYYHS